jgi:hypothetical protein
MPSKALKVSWQSWWNEGLFNLNKQGAMRVITIDEGDARTVAINLDLLVHGRL